ncbi:unnamed protein product [Symbiodinium sp. CCMP2592]|nr:unnamed protein product [Symbiodinium sp. CCMP2592]
MDSDLEGVNAEVPQEHTPIEEKDAADDIPEVQSESEDDSPQTVHVLNTVQERAANILTKMEVTHPAILRGTPAYKVLRCFGRVLRNDSIGRDLFCHSRQTCQIQVFVSHNWHGSALQKILLLLIVESGRPALVAGLIAATLAAIVQHLAGIATEPRTPGAALFSLISGLLASTVTFFLWRPHHLVFLDRICISQTDRRLKGNGLLNMGAILRHSSSMLVCWDATYMERLWCAFELAAFLFSHGEEANLYIRPTHLGLSMVVLYLSLWGTMLGVDLFAPGANSWLWFLLVLCVLCIIGFYFVVDTFRNYLASVQNLQEKLSRFAFADTRCHCCSVNHLRRDGTKMLCDREILQKCIRSWFGSIDNFDKSVQSSVSAAFRKQLGRNTLPYLWMLGVGSPILWALLSIVVQELLIGDYTLFVRDTVYLLAYWLLALPLILAVTFKLVFCMRKRRGCIVDFFLNSFCVLVILVMFAAVDMSNVMIKNLLGATSLAEDIVEVLHELVWAVLLLLGVLCLWRRSIVEWLTVDSVRETPATLPTVSAVGSGQGHVIF